MEVEGKKNDRIKESLSKLSEGLELVKEYEDLKNKKDDTFQEKLRSIVYKEHNLNKFFLRVD